MLGEKDEIVRLLFPSFRIEKIDAPVSHRTVLLSIA